MRVGDYIRTNRGIIAKIIKFNSTGSIICDRSVYYGFNIVNTKRILKDLSIIIKSSPNIIDLIEVGDYVNGLYVYEKAPVDKRKKQIIRVDDSSYNEYAECPLKNEEIKSILTKEQFEQMEYKVGE